MHTHHIMCMYIYIYILSPKNVDGCWLKAPMIVEASMIQPHFPMDIPSYPSYPKAVCFWCFLLRGWSMTQLLGSSNPWGMNLDIQ